MMGWKLDRIATREAIRSKRFKCRRSRMGMKGDEHLAGIDKSNRRHEIYMRARGMCQACPVPHFVSWERGEWDHHPISGLGKPDNLSNGRWVCRASHRLKHVHPKFGVQSSNEKRHHE